MSGLFQCFFRIHCIFLQKISIAVIIIHCRIAGNLLYGSAIGILSILYTVSLNDTHSPAKTSLKRGSRNKGCCHRKNRRKHTKKAGKHDSPEIFSTHKPANIPQRDSHAKQSGDHRIIKMDSKCHAKTHGKKCQTPCRR